VPFCPRAPVAAVAERPTAATMDSARVGVMVGSQYVVEEVPRQ
jgi:hypothetical protein